ncbi:MAG: hypothetical protein AAGG56_15960 [Pseudomonadota bacterium]
MAIEGIRDRVRDGSCRDTRRARALDDKYFLPEERSLPIHLARSAAVAGGIGFVNDANVPVGTWQRLFAEEPAAIMAELIAVSPEDERARFAELIETDPAAAATELLALARRVHDWLERASTRGRALFSAQLEGLRNRDDPFALATALASSERADPAALAQIVQETGFRSGAGTGAIAQARAACQALARAHDQLLNIMATLRPKVEAAFETRVASGLIDPAMGLILTEIGLLRQMAEVTNAFPDRHAAFYYGDVLGLEPRGAQPESVHLRFTPGGVPTDIPNGSHLLARIPGQPEPLMYRLAETLRVAPVKIAALCSLRYRRDPLISPQSELGYITGVSARRLRLEPETGPEARQPRLFAPGGPGDAELGLAVSSPLLALSGGRRKIEVSFHLEARTDQGSAPPTPQTDCETTEKARQSYGRTLAAGLIEGQPWPSGDERRRLLNAISAQLGGPAAAKVAEQIFSQPREDVFQTLLQDAFSATLSSEEGEIVPAMLRAAPNEPEDGPGFTISLTLSEADPAITAPGDAEAPVLTLRLAPDSRFCPVSLLEGYAMERVSVSVEVAGLTRLSAFSDDGPLSTAQPFMPFGPRPQDGAAFLVGAPELASKPVNRLGVDITWADLPRAPGGYRGYYQPYGEAFEPPDPEVTLSYLTGEGWKDLGQGPEPLVAESAPGGPLLPRRRFEGVIPGRAKAARRGTGPEAFRQRQTIRAGLLRLDLWCGPDGFGHEGYPAILAEAMRPSLFSLKKRSMPPPPVAPQIATISLDYSAHGAITLSTPQAARPGERVVQIGPFGRAEIYPHRGRPGAGLLPKRFADGSLFICVAGAAATGPVSLLFEMQPGSHRRRSFQPASVSWHYLTAAGWQPLPGWSLGTDTTEGLMRTGVVTLDVPDEDVLLSGGEMSSEGVWLAVSADDHLDAFPRLASISVNGARAERVGDPAESSAGLAGARWSVEPPVAAIGAITQVGPVLGGAPAETEAAFRIRASEGLRHRQRAVTAWDVERIILDRFPEVWKVKCLPAAIEQTEAGSRASDGWSTGAETIIAVVPEAPEEARELPSQPAMFDVLTLRRIEAYIAECSGAFCVPRVRNPSYERLQIRAQVSFVDKRDTGLALRQLKLDVSKFLSVWTAKAPLDGFGWSLNLHDVAAFLRGLDYVSALSGFSILHLARDDRNIWRLFDTAREDGDGDEAGNGRQVLCGREPWSLALPMADHWITVQEAGRLESAKPTGIGGLGIGETLVVDAARSA